jgi:hypothetical protein
MSKKPLIVITENDLEPEDESIITIGPEDLEADTAIAVEPEDALDAAIVITSEDITEGDMRALFRTPLARQFVAFVSAGLPDVFLRAHLELLRDSSRKQIASVVDQVPDQALKKHLASRLGAIERFQAEREGQT